MTMPDKIYATYYADHPGKSGLWDHVQLYEWEEKTEYIRSDLVIELLEKMKALRDDAYGYDYLYETPFHGQVCEAIDDALSRYIAATEGK